MCGIAGIVDLRSNRAIDREALQRMTDALAHRGPDGEGYFTAPGVGIGHRRLAIIDKPGGAQPFHSHDDKGVLSFNGEIYNYQTLAPALTAAGARLKTRSDTEVLAEGLALHGAPFVHELRGMFAFAFWDQSSETLLLARDRMGEKPLYYGETDDGFLLFASEIGALISARLLPLDIDPQAVSDYFHFGYVPDPKSIYQRIRKLNPGSTLTARRGATIQIERYWRPVLASSENLKFDAAKDQLLEALDQSVRLQLVSDAPLGAFLSGGVDSSAIVASMARASSAIKTCTIGFEEDAHDERDYARQVAQQYGAEHREEVAHMDHASLIDDLAGVYGEPFADSSALPTYIVSKLARRHVTVALSGDGADELFAGYRRYPFFLKEEALRGLAPLALRRLLFAPAGALYPKLDWAPRPLRLKTTLQSLGDSSASAYARAVGANLPDRVRHMLSGEFKTSLNTYSSTSLVEKIMRRAEDHHPLSLAQLVDLHTWLPGRMLTKIDRASMAHSLEVRAPFLDHKLVEWAGMLPPAFKLKGNEGKFILKKALAPRLGHDILYRPKQGFASPIAQWLKQKPGPLERLKDSHAWRRSGYLNPEAIEKMALAHQQGRADYSQELWTVIMFDGFMQRHEATLAA